MDDNSDPQDQCSLKKTPPPAATPTQIERDEEMKRQIRENLQNQAHAPEGLTQVEKDEEMKRQVRQTLNQPPVAAASAPSPPTQGERDEALQQQMREHMSKPAVAAPTQAERDEALKHQMREHMSKPAVAAPTQAERDEELKHQMREHMSKPVTHQPSSNVDIPNRASMPDAPPASAQGDRDFQDEDDVELANASNTEGRNALASNGAAMSHGQPVSARNSEDGAMKSRNTNGTQQVGAFSVQERAVGSQPAWGRENNQARGESISASQASESHLPPEMRSLPPEMRGFVEESIDISDSIPEISGMSAGGGGTSTRPAPEEATITTVGASQTEEKIQTRKWYYIIGILLVVVVGAVGAGVGVALSGSDDDSSESESKSIPSAPTIPTPTQAPVQVVPQCPFKGIDPDIAKLSDDALARYKVLLEDFAAQVVPDFTAPVNPDDYCTPTNLALIWLAGDDVNSSSSEEQLRNRYILGIFYVESNGIAWKEKTGWLTDVSECEWHGVTCDDGGKKITKLDLSRNELRSTIPSEIGLLSGLQKLNLPENGLVGQVPTTIDALSNLTYLSLINNDLTGTFPFVELSSLSNLADLRVTNNKLNGQISPAVGNFVGLEQLRLGFNSFDGAIPSEIGGLARLERFDIVQNPLVTSSIPTEFGRLQNLQHLYLVETGIAGTLPTELGSCTSLERLWVSGLRLSGKIPSQLGNLTSLTYLHAKGCDFSGTIPDSIFSIASLVSLNLANNLMTGSIPSDVSMLTNLDCLDVQSNFLSDIVPPELCETPLETPVVAVDCGSSNSGCTCCECAAPSNSNLGHCEFPYE